MLTMPDVPSMLIEPVLQRKRRIGYGRVDGLTRRDLEPLIGSRARVAEVLNRKRNLTLPMIRRLHERLRIPADSLIHEPRPSRAA